MASSPTAKLSIPPAVLKYLRELELVLKQMPGVCPEDALCDAREFLLADAEALTRSREAPTADVHYDWIVQNFGPPEQVAQQYATEVQPHSATRPGYAPGWRICCTHCGRSTPLANTGAIRIAAYSYHKYKLGYCHSCGRLRWCRILQDLNDTNLTDQLCNNQSAEQLRHSMHARYLALKIIALTLGLVLGINAIVWSILIFWFKIF